MVGLVFHQLCAYSQQTFSVIWKFFAYFWINDAFAWTFFTFYGGVLAVHCKDFACSGRCNVVGHYIELHMFPNQFLQSLLEIIEEKSR